MTSLTRKTSSGFLWLLGVTIVTQALSLTQLLVLGNWLEKGAFELLALTFTVTSLAALLQQGGLSQSLVQKHDDIHRWTNAAFWLSLLLGFGAGLAVLGLAWPVSHLLYQRPDLVVLIAIAAISMPITALATVPDALLRTELRFRPIAAASVAAIVTQVTLAILMAWAGFGAFSLVVPPVVGALVRCITLWACAPSKIHRSPHTHLWRALLSSGVLVLTGSIMMAWTYQAALIILGWQYPAATYVAIFYFAWNISDQGVRVLVNNLQQVLFPSLRSLADDPQRQTSAFLRAVCLLMLIGTPLAAAQAIVAEHILRLAWGDKWLAAAPVMTALSLGMISRLAFGPSESLILARQRNRTYAVVTTIYAVAFTVAVFAGAYYGAALGTAIATAACMLLLAPAVLFVAVPAPTTRVGPVLRVIALPVAMSAVAGAAAWFAVHALPPAAAWSGPWAPRWNLPARDLAACVTTAVCFAAVYLPMFRAFAPSEWRELFDRVRDLRARRAPASTSAANTAS